MEKNKSHHPARLERPYQNSLLKIGAFDGGRLVGMIRVVGDGESVVLIQDILVLPEYQRRGIGTKLIHAVMERYASVYQVELLTDDTEKTVSFYKSVGLTRADERGYCTFLKVKA